MADANEELRRMLRGAYEALYGPQGEVPFSHTVADAVDAVDDAVGGAVDMVVDDAMRDAIWGVLRDA